MYSKYRQYIDFAFDVQLISFCVHQTYDSWNDKWLRFQESLPEFSWLKELKDSLPDLSNPFAGGIVTAYLYTLYIYWHKPVSDCWQTCNLIG